MNIDKLNFKGNYKSHTPDGVLIQYSLGDVVFYSGQTYVATKPIKDQSPAHGDSSGWQMLTSGSSTIQFYWGAETPLTPNVGDEWFNTTNGRIYKYLPDGDTEQWVNSY
jgi:hypothetical protein